MAAALDMPAGRQRVCTALSVLILFVLPASGRRVYAQDDDGLDYPDTADAGWDEAADVRAFRERRGPRASALRPFRAMRNGWYDGVGDVPRQRRARLLPVEVADGGYAARARPPRYESDEDLDDGIPEVASHRRREKYLEDPSLPSRPRPIDAAAVSEGADGEGLEPISVHVWVLLDRRSGHITRSWARLLSGEGVPAAKHVVVNNYYNQVAPHMTHPPGPTASSNTPAATGTAASMPTVLTFSPTAAASALSPLPPRSFATTALPGPPTTAPMFNDDADLPDSYESEYDEVTSEQPLLQQSPLAPALQSWNRRQAQRQPPHYVRAPAGAGTPPATTPTPNALEPLAAASDLETYLGSNLRDDESKPSLHVGHLHHAAPRPRPREPRRRRPAAAGGHVGLSGRAVGAGTAGSAPRMHEREHESLGPSRKRCFSIVTENRVKRYRETPC